MEEGCILKSLAPKLYISTTTIYLKNNNEQLVPQIVTKLIEAGQMNTGTGTLEKSNKNLQIQTCKNFT